VFYYDGRAFRPGGEDMAGGTQARYHQDADLVWGEFAGGHVRRGSLAGTCAPDGVLCFAYSMVLDSGEIISGYCRSTPQLLDDGRIRLSEEWERYTPTRETGVSYLDEIPAMDGSSARAR
jgi:hypothetical protein